MTHNTSRQLALLAALLVHAAAFAAPAGVLVVENGGFDKPGDTWLTGGGVPDGWTVENHEVRIGKGGPQGDAGSIGLNHRWRPLTPTSPRSLYLINANGARLSQKLQGTMATGMTYQIQFAVLRRDWAPASVVMRLRVGERTVIEVDAAEGELPRRIWQREEHVYVAKPEDAGKPVTLEFELSGKGDLRLDEVHILSLTPQMLALLERLEALSGKVAALPTSTAAEKRKQAALNLALEQANFLGEASLVDKMETLLGDVEAALPRAMGRLVTPQRGIGFSPATEVWDGNAYVESLLRWAETSLAKEDYPFRASTVEQRVFRGVYHQYSSRGEAQWMTQYLWLAAHPRTPHREDPEVLTRLLRRAHAYMAEYALAEVDTENGGWRVNPGVLNDFFALGPALDAANGIREAFPDILLPSQLATWDQAVRNARDSWFGSYQREAEAGKRPFSSYCNHDLGAANILLNVGHYLNEAAVIAAARDIVDAQEANLYPDGAFSYIGSQNESGGYHSADCTFLARFYARDGYEKCIELLKGTRDYAPLSIEPGNVTEYSTVPYWKTTWNSSYGLGGEPVVALTGSPYVRGIIDQAQRYSGKASADPLEASWYRTGVEAKPLPTDYIVIDRNIRGPRGRYGRFSFTLNGRKYLDTEAGKMTFAGAMIVDPIDERPHPLNAALKMVYAKIHIQKKDNTEWQDWAYLTRAEQTAVSASKRVGALTTSYHNHLVSYGGQPMPDVPWGGAQQWLALPDRLVGMVEVFPLDGEQQAYQVDGRVRLGYGRSGPLRPKEMKVIDDTRYEYGDLLVRLHDHNYASIDTADSGVIRDSVRKATEIRFHDGKSGSNSPDALTTYTPEDRLFFTVEVYPAWAEAAEQVQIIRTPAGLRGLRVDEPTRTVVLVHNPGDTSQDYHPQLSALEGAEIMMLPSGSTPGEQPTQLDLAPDQPTVLKIPPHAHVQIIRSRDPQDLSAAPATFAEMANQEE